MMVRAIWGWPWANIERIIENVMMMEKGMVVQDHVMRASLHKYTSLIS